MGRRRRSLGSCTWPRAAMMRAQNRTAQPRRGRGEGAGPGPQGSPHAAPPHGEGGPEPLGVPRASGGASSAPSLPSPSISVTSFQSAALGPCRWLRRSALVCPPVAARAPLAMGLAPLWGFFGREIAALCGFGGSQVCRWG